MRVNIDEDPVATQTRMTIAPLVLQFHVGTAVGAMQALDRLARLQRSRSRPPRGRT